MLGHRFQTDALRPSREFPYLPLAAEQCLGRDAPFRFRSEGKAEAQELAILRPCHRALCLIHLELESPPEEARHALHDSLPRPFARHVDIAIISLAHEAMLAPLQFLLEFVESCVLLAAPYCLGLRPGGLLCPLLTPVPRSTWIAPSSVPVP